MVNCWPTRLPVRRPGGQDLHSRRAIELARTAAGQGGLALALTASSLSAISGAGIQPATMAALDEAANLTEAHPDRFTETIMHALRARLFATLGQLDAAETEVGLCWAAGQGGAVRLAESHGANRETAAHAASQARNVLGDDWFTQAQKEGQGLTLDDAVAYATRRGGGRERPATGWASLTPAELEVVRLVSEGLRNDAIARRLFITPGTVKVHLSHIFAKTGITTRAELAAQAASRNLTAR